MQGARRLNEHRLFDALILRLIGGGFHAHLVGVLFASLLESLLQLGRQRAGIVHRTHHVLVGLQLAHVFVRIALRRDVGFEATGLQRRDHQKDNDHYQQHVNQRGYVNERDGATAPASHSHKNYLFKKAKCVSKPITWVTGPGVPSLSSRRSRGLTFALLLIGNQAYPINAFFANRIDYFDDLAIANLNATLDIDDLLVFLLVCQRFFHASFEFIEAHLLLAQVVFTIFRDRDDHRTVSIDRCVFFRILHVTGQRQLNILLQEGRDHHEDDQQHQHDVDHRSNVDLRLKPTTTSCHSHKNSLFSSGPGDCSATPLDRQRGPGHASNNSLRVTESVASFDS